MASTQQQILSRSFIPLGEQKEGAPVVSVLQWNTLADSYATTDSFPFVDPKLLKWEYRKGLLLQEIIRKNPDVLCLQEVDEDKYHTFFLSELKQIGYEGIFIKKLASDSKDGCAMFYLASRLALVKTSSLPITSSTSQVAIFSKFKMLSVASSTTTTTTSSSSALPSFYVVCCHLKAKEGYDQVRLVQGYELLISLTKFMDACEQSNVKLSYTDLPLIICGDFNEVFDGPAIQLFLKAQFKGPKNPDMKNKTKTTSNGVDKQNRNIDKKEEDGKHESKEEKVYSHSFQLKSLYDDYFLSQTQHQHQHFFTTLKKRQELIQRSIDYIWHSKSIVPCGLLSIPSLNELKNYLPAIDYPSDHLALGGIFRL